MAGRATASNPQVRNPIGLSPLVAKSAPRTLSRWSRGAVRDHAVARDPRLVDALGVTEPGPRGGSGLDRRDQQGQGWPDHPVEVEGWLLRPSRRAGRITTGSTRRATLAWAPARSGPGRWTRSSSRPAGTARLRQMAVASHRQREVLRHLHDACAATHDGESDRPTGDPSRSAIHAISFLPIPFVGARLDRVSSTSRRSGCPGRPRDEHEPRMRTRPIGPSRLKEEPGSARWWPWSRVT